ncbi:prolipoprotein diacylglyceryl transferase family protein, partial [Escherichia coli]|uniref:prolipoprotein diacylglyceryl transferase family protein n=1 Tax=Escherichia coli TaxID=562 RepID=UPI00126FE0F6
VRCENVGAWMAVPGWCFGVWEGGILLHGVRIGFVLAMIIFDRRTKRFFCQGSEFSAPFMRFGLGAGRRGNFLNGELGGRVDPN